MILVLFGLAGSGKNYIGELLQKNFGYYFWDGDNSLPEDIQLAIINKKKLSLEMRDRITYGFIENIKILAQTYPNLVVTQALYKEKNRIQIKALLPEANLIYIKASAATTLNRIKQRNNLVTQDYANDMMNEFEEPKHFHFTINNNNDSASQLLHQLANLQKKLRNE